MSEKNNGGPAFPESCNGSIIPGMTLRDYFAGQSLAAASAWDFSQNEMDRGILAIRCYRIADAMLEGRSK